MRRDLELAQEVREPPRRAAFPRDLVSAALHDAARGTSACECSGLAGALPMTALPSPRACPDCPATTTRRHLGLVERPAGCAFRCLAVEARQPLPMRWRGEYGLALVRRGIVMRQRVDGVGRTTAIDIAGPGSALPVAPVGESGDGGYAVSDVLLCLAPTDALEAAVCEGRANALDVVHAQSSMLERVERIAEARGRAAATSRVAGLLLALSDTLSPTRRISVIPPAIQQRDLAALLALRHESVCRSIASLEKRIVVIRTPQGLRILDRRALASL